MLLELSTRPYKSSSATGYWDRSKQETKQPSRQVNSCRLPCALYFNRIAQPQQQPPADLQLNMLCPSAFHQPAALSPFMDFHWPVRSLWPETRPLFFQMEQEMMRHMQEMRNNMEFMERLHQKIFNEIDQGMSLTTFKPITFQVGKRGEQFAVTLETKDYAPGELEVKQVGRKLRVSGKTEKKQDDGKGSYSYKSQEFRQEFDLPEGVDPETVTCSLAEGRLQISAPNKALPEGGKERVVPIELAPGVKSKDTQALTDGEAATSTKD